MACCSIKGLRGCFCMLCLQVVLDVTLQLYFMYLINTPRLKLARVTRVSHVTPYVWLSALLLVAIKLLYGLGNSTGAVSIGCALMCCVLALFAVRVCGFHSPSRSHL